MSEKPMTADRLYEILDDNGVAFEVVEVFEGIRTVRAEVQEGETE
jgi:hypothetical protein